MGGSDGVDERCHAHYLIDTTTARASHLVLRLRIISVVHAKHFRDCPEDFPRWSIHLGSTPPPCNPSSISRPLWHGKLGNTPHGKGARAQGGLDIETGQDASSDGGIDAITTGGVVLRDVQVRAEGQHQLPGSHQREKASKGSRLQHAGGAINGFTGETPSNPAGLAAFCRLLSML